MLVVKKLVLYAREMLNGNIHPLDIATILWYKAWLHGQARHNFYVGKYRFFDNLSNRELTIVVLAGKYARLWNVTFERLNAYSIGADVLVINPGRLNSDKAERMCKDYGFSYFECTSKSFEAAQNFVNAFIVKSPLVLKMDDDTFLTKNTIRNLLRAYNTIKSEGYDIGFIAPILNVNNVSYYYFLKTLNLVGEYTREFERPIFVRNGANQKIWYDEKASEWIWERSLPLNVVAEIFERRNNGSVELIPVRFSISCILYERGFLLKRKGTLASYRLANMTQRPLSTSAVPAACIPWSDESSINFYADDSMHGRFLVLDAFAGHLCYYPQTDAMLKWFEKNKQRFFEDLGR